MQEGHKGAPGTGSSQEISPRETLAEQNRNVEIETGDSEFERDGRPSRERERGDFFPSLSLSLSLHFYRFRSRPRLFSIEMRSPLMHNSRAETRESAGGWARRRAKVKKM